MSDGAAANQGLRRRLALRVVEPGQETGVVVPGGGESSPCLRGRGSMDYACGGCGTLLAIGVRPGAFHSLLFACACGALNRVAEPS